MRLTPIRTRSSTGSDPDETGVSTDVKIYHASTGRQEDESNEPVSAADPALYSESNLVSVLEDLDTPVTVDEVTDQLVRSYRSDDVTAWGDVHERLHQIELPALAADGIVEFDTNRGTVDLSDDRTGSSFLTNVTTRTSVVTASLGLISILLVAIAPATATVLSVTLFALSIITYVRIE